MRIFILSRQTVCVYEVCAGIHQCRCDHTVAEAKIIIIHYHECQMVSESLVAVSLKHVELIE